MNNTKKYRISYYEDFFTIVDEIIVECENEAQLNKLAKEYYENNLSHLDNIAGSNWHKLSE